MITVDDVVNVIHEEATEEWRVPDEVGEHRQDRDLDFVGATDDLGQTCLDGGLIGRGQGAVRGRQPIEPPDQRGQEQIVLVGEVVVEDPVGEPRRTGNVAARDRRRPAIGEEMLCGVDQAGADVACRRS